MLFLVPFVPFVAEINLSMWCKLLIASLADWAESRVFFHQIVIGSTIKPDISCLATF